MHNRDTVLRCWQVEPPRALASATRWPLTIVPQTRPTAGTPSHMPTEGVLMMPFAARNASRNSRPDVRRAYDPHRSERRMSIHLCDDPAPARARFPVRRTTFRARLAPTGRPATSCHRRRGRSVPVIVSTATSSIVDGDVSRHRRRPRPVIVDGDVSFLWLPSVAIALPIQERRAEETSKRALSIADHARRSGPKPMMSAIRGRFHG
jgi:hypothetical protein